MDSSQCLDENQLIAFVQDQLSREEKAKAESHLDQCTDCREFLVFLVDNSLVSQALQEAPASEALEGEEPTPLLRSSSLESWLAPGTHVGRYLILQPIGMGGMGVVYAAYDPELDRKVALKLLRLQETKASLASEGQARLIREAVMLARLSHPHILTVFDMGTLEEQVFIAMEFIEGQTLQQWLAEAPRSQAEILEMFRQAGEGLVAAHNSGIIHRDFKPSNVLISEEGRLRVMDFGLARSVLQEENLEQREDEEALAHFGEGDTPWDETLTKTGMLLGTPAYMAPEQFVGKVADEQSDQFAFCVTLYEALYGERPFRASNFAQLRAVVEQGEVQEPEGSQEVSVRLRSILLRGLQPSPGDRYESMQALLDALYEESSLTGQRRWQIGLIVALLLAVLSFPLWRPSAPKPCQGSEARLAGIWDAARQKTISLAFGSNPSPFAKKAWSTSQRVLNSYAKAWKKMYKEACEATHVLGEQSPQLLDLRMQCLHEERDEFQALTDLFSKADTTVIKRAVRASYALGSLRRCADTRALRDRSLLPLSLRPQALRLRRKLARARSLQKAGKMRQSYRLTKAFLTEAKRFKYQPLKAEALFHMGLLQSNLRRHRKAERSLLEAIWAAQAGHEDRVAAQAWTLLMEIHSRQSRYGRSSLSAQHAEATLKRLGGDLVLRAQLYHYQGLLAHRQGKFNKARTLLWKAITLLRKVFSWLHPSVVQALNNLGATYDVQGDIQKAFKHYQHSFRLKVKLLGPNHPDVATAYGNLGNVLTRQGHWEQALQYHQHALKLKSRVFGPFHPRLAPNLIGIAAVLQRKGKREEALRTLRRALLILKKVYKARFRRIPYTASIWAHMSDIYREQGVLEKALSYANKALNSLRAFLPSHHPFIAFTRLTLGDVYRDQGRFDLALAQYKKSLPKGKQRRKSNTHRANTLMRIGRLYQRQRETKKALSALTQAYQLLKKTHKLPQPDLLRSLSYVGQIQFLMGRRAIALRTLQKVRKVTPPSMHREHFYCGALFAMAQAL